MTVSYSEARIEVERLVDRFAGLCARNRKHYNEAATRQEFILPLFRALGWNVEDAREVSPEEQVSRGYVDFAFRLGGIPRFFLETKKILTDLDDPQWARQAINYAWLKGVTWAVLTDFEGLKVFNAEWQETIPIRAIFKDLHWQHYLERFDDLWLLSRPAIAEGVLDQAAEAVGKKARRSPVSRLLFADLTEWRRELFRHLRPYNPTQGVEQIDEAVQRILDRLIFIRTCEDREIESVRLHPLLRQWRDQGRKRDLLAQLNALFREFDAAYDSRLFAPHLCEELTSDPGPYERVIEGLYEVPGGYGLYDFNAIDADVLGTIYEQYLGHRAQDPEGKQVVDRRARRKAQGIYYTPQFVVRYIVGQTLGRLLQERDYEQARQVKVLDMACGSGSFLIEAFDVLDRYLANMRGQHHTPLSRPSGEGPGVRAAGDAHDLARRMEILTGNLYGVDLDAQAVEIARLNLLLKAVNQRGLLPPLDNVRRGNSLISGAPAELEAAFGPGWRDRHPFNWGEEFPQVMERGGFDVTVGNPPYGAELSKPDQEYFRARFEYQDYQLDSYLLFLERAVSLLSPGGYLGLILPNTWLTSLTYTGVRRLLTQQMTILNIGFISKQVFPDAVVDTVILIVQKRPPQEGHAVEIVQRREDDWEEIHSVPQERWIMLDGQPINIFLDKTTISLLQRTHQISRSLGDVCIITQGCKPYQTGKGNPPQTREVVDSKPFDSERKNDDTFRPLLRGSYMNRYVILWKDNYWISYGEWLAEPRPSAGYDLPEKIVIRQTGDSLVATLDRQQFVVRDNLYTIRLRDRGVDLRYILGLINSRFMTFVYQSINPERGEALAQVKKGHLVQLPIRRINFDDPADVARHDRMVALVEEMLRLQREKAAAEAALLDSRHDLARQIERLDAQIDALVYELYGLTEEEIAVVEGRSQE